MDGSFAVTSDHSDWQGRGVEQAKSRRRRTHSEVEASAMSVVCLCLTETGITHTGKVSQQRHYWASQVSKLELNIPFQHKYGYIRDERSGMESYPYPMEEG